ncbi:outer membrane beta-barrel protein [Seonamhaeicola aphaedonensis]|uniref:Outer membrane protein with beta-barrel domain n=1 Tax=Seonamhaeicola aphaedonensis TaxID=1461338 RepID=A0A3D9H890_9FLAO|nr:outer membrane beta-barrel protein [Seonamhaeicola aphaedonensis]RED45712.1 outer membrane protein with beta-barrel domain [Seonamhaeicola aphaedonensis]
MNFSFEKIKLVFYFYGCLLFTNLSFSQEGTSLLKAQFALGVNNPSSNGFVGDFEGKGINFPTVDLGLQYMFSSSLGARLDYSFSRISNEDSTPTFKLNYSRINAQLVYDASNVLTFLPPRIGVFIHVGPGYSMVKPLGNYTQNKESFFNIMAGMQFHYGISDKLSIYTDVSYINGFGKDFDPVSDGFGSFNGNLLTITFGASISLSGCYYCD